MREKLLTENEFIGLLWLTKGAVSLRPFAAQLGVAKSALHKALNGEVSPGFAIAAAMGYEPVIMYRKLKTRNGKE